MNIVLITDNALNKRHGTGAQNILTFTSPEIRFVHFYVRDDFVPSESKNSFHMKDNGPQGKSWKTGPFAERLRYSAGFCWSMRDKPELSGRRLQRVLRGLRFKADVVYVIASFESTALSISDLLQKLGLPYIVHIMDIAEKNGLHPETMPGFARLLRGAHSVLCITPTVQEEVRKFGVERTSLVMIGQEPNKYEASPPNLGEPIRMILVGNSYPVGMQLLSDTMEEIGRLGFPVEFSYMGAAYYRLPEALKSRVRDLGLVDNDSYQRNMARSHIAYLCGPSINDAAARYSFPSRTSDYLMAGLPVLACVIPESATERLLFPLSPEAVRFTHTPQALAEGIRHFREKSNWQSASSKAKNFALETMDITKVRKQILDTLMEACL